MTPIRAVIFDMDGLLIDTEPIWRAAEIEVFSQVGLQLTEEQCLETMGVRIAEVVRLWYERHPWTGATVEEITDRIEQAVIAAVLAGGEPKAGVCEALDMVRDLGLPAAIASSSSEELIAAVVERLQIAPYIQVICSAVHECEGKPHPAVYLRAAEKLDLPPAACLALEDSPNGVLSARAAGMTCIAVPDPLLAADPRMASADLILPSLLEFTPAVIERLSAGAAPVPGKE